MMYQLKPKKRKIFIFLSILLLLLTSSLLYIGFSTPEIEYEVTNGYSGYHSILVLNRDRSYSLMITTHRGSSTIAIKDNITNRQMKNIRRELLTSRFLTLNKDLSDYSSLDNSTEKLKVSIGFIQLETAGYGIRNKRFRNIVKELEELIAAHR